MTTRSILDASLFVLACCALSACNGSTTLTDALTGPGQDAGPRNDSGGGSNDTGTSNDSGVSNDAGGNPDTGMTGNDAEAQDNGGGPTDTGMPDTGTGHDGGMQTDAGMPVDAGTGGHHIQTVFMILMENKNWADIKGNSSATFINGLLAMGAHAENYHGAPGVHPSEPNYIYLAAGDNFGIGNDNDPPHSVGGSGNHISDPNHLGGQLNTNGITWKAWEENISGTVCPLSSEEPPMNDPDYGHGYRPKHDPFVFFDTLTGNFDPMNADCIAHNRPLAEFYPALQNNQLPRFNFITPNLCNDMHDSCSPVDDDVKQGDTFLSMIVPTIMGSQAYQQGGLLIITWDESETNLSCPSLDPDCPIGMIMLSPFAKTNYSNMTMYTHASMLRTIEEIFGITTYLRAAATATDLSDMFTAFP